MLEGGVGSDTLQGLAGDNILIGSKAGASVAEIDVLVGGTGRDRFVIQSQYRNFGSSDYALIRDFSTTDDVIQLGAAAHTLSDMGSGAAIYNAAGELIAIVQGHNTSTLDLDASYFE